MKRTAGIIHGPDDHHLDHLAPLCALLKIPLLLSTPQQMELATTFYPDLTPKFIESPEIVVRDWDTLITSTTRPLFEEVFFFAQQFQRKKIETIWCPHGNSDKGRLSTYMEALKEEETVLVYGSLLANFLKEKGIRAKQIPVGNYRLSYFQKHRDFYEKLLPTFSKGPTLLYAPTWQDQEKSSSFPHVLPYLLNGLPKDWQLIIKLHPHLYHQFPDEIAQLRSANALLIENFPPIYPLLEKIDLYIGDRSSVGYDFLAFDRPLVFLDRQNQQLPLLQCGPIISEENILHLYQVIEQELSHSLRNSFKRRGLYAQTFANVKQLYIDRHPTFLYNNS